MDGVHHSPGDPLRDLVAADIGGVACPGAGEVGVNISRVRDSGETDAKYAKSRLLVPELHSSVEVITGSWETTGQAYVTCIILAVE